MKKEAMNDERRVLVEHIGTELRRVLEEVLDERGVGRRTVKPLAEQCEGFDVKTVPDSFMDFIKYESKDERRKIVKAMRKDIKSAAEKLKPYKSLDRAKSQLLGEAFESRIKCKMIRWMPSYQVVVKLFGDLVDIGESSYSTFKTKLQTTYATVLEKRLQ